MSEFIHQFIEPFVDERDERQYSVRVYGAKDGNIWHGWLEFYPLDEGIPFRTDRETEQATRLQLMYWATGLSGVYLEGAFHRARPLDQIDAPPP